MGIKKPLSCLSPRLSSAAPKPFEKTHGRVSVRRKQGLLLKGLDRGPGFRADDAVGAAGIESPGGQQPLQILDVAPGKRHLLVRALALQWPAADKPVGQMADGNGIED